VLWLDEIEKEFAMSGEMGGSSGPEFLLRLCHGCRIKRLPSLLLQLANEVDGFHQEFTEGKIR